MNPLPESFVHRLHQQYPHEAKMILDSLGENASTSLQLNPGKSFELPWKNKEIPWFRNGRILEQRPSFTFDPLFHAGCYYPQESSSMFLDHVLNSLEINEDIRVLDLCAAPGGKSNLLSSWLGQNGLLVSNEVVMQRNHILQENLTKSGRANFIVTRNEASGFSQLDNYFDVIVVDAPCSGEGMFRKDHDARGEWSENNVQMCSIRQRTILGDIIPSLKNGGYLVYCTCTFAKEENDENCQWLTELGELEAVKVPVQSNWNIQTEENPNFCAYRFLPGAIPGEGFFMSVFRKHGELSGRRKYNSRKQFFRRPNKSEKSLLLEWVQEIAIENILIRQDGLVISCMTDPVELNFICQSLQLTQAGIELGEIGQQSFIPSHGLAMSQQFSNTIPKVELDLQQSIHYLKKEDPGIDAPKGWVLFTYQGHSLGFGKSIQGRINNYYPKNWRIRSTQ